MAKPIVVGALEELIEGIPRIVAIEGNKQIVCVKQGEKIVAFENRCPHYNIPMPGPPVQGGRVKCNYHGLVFDIESGVCVSNGGWCKNHEKYSLQTYQAEARDGVVYLTPNVPEDIK